MTGGRACPTRCRHGALGVVLACALAAAGCDREQRVLREDPSGAPISPEFRASEIQPGPILLESGRRLERVQAIPRPFDERGRDYQDNRWAVAQGQIYFTEFNCAGCHAPGGGGGMGPPLSDEEWRYGSEPEDVFATILEGRPNGMPSFGGRITDDQAWQLVAYVRAMAGLTPKDTWPGRGDHMNDALPERERHRPPRGPR